MDNKNHTLPSKNNGFLSIVPNSLGRYLGSTYSLIDPLKDSVKGYYNSHTVFMIIVLILTCFGLFNIPLAIFLFVSYSIALLLDLNENSVSISALPMQLVTYLELVIKWIGDVWKPFLLAFLLYLVLGRYLQNMSLLGGPWYAFLIVYSFYFLFRLYFLIRYLLTIAFNWNGSSSFEIKLANLNTPKIASKHMIWAFFLGNLGLTIRCGKQFIFLWLIDHIITAFRIPLPIFELGNIYNSILWFVYILLTLFVLVYFMLIIYYKVHRTLHENRTLFIFLHRIHHEAIYPIVLDSGTISPLEFILTETGAFMFILFPDWLFVLESVLLAVGHLVGHNTLIKNERLHHHVQHHRLLNVNYAEPVADRFFGSFFDGKFYESISSD